MKPLPLRSLVVTVCTTRFNIEKKISFAHRVHVCVGMAI